VFQCLRDGMIQLGKCLRTHPGWIFQMGQEFTPQFRVFSQTSLINMSHSRISRD